MTYKSFTEKEVRKQIIRKIAPKTHKSRAGHKKGLIEVMGKEVIRFKIPNPHKNSFSLRKSKILASQLKLSLKDFLALIDCTKSGDEYYADLEALFSTDHPS